MSNKSKKSKQINLVFSIVVGIAALAFFAYSSSPSEQRAEPRPIVEEIAPSQVRDLSSTEPSSAQAPGPTPGTVFPHQAVLGSAPVTAPDPSTIPEDLPEDLRQQLLAPPPELPEDLKAQLNAPPPSLPQDLKDQLANQPKELPADLQRQLAAPPPELPDDIKEAMKTPPRVVTIEEVNTPPDPGF